MADLVDPLNVSVQLGGVDTTLPLLPEGDYLVQCVDSSVDPNKDKTGYNWNVAVALTDAHTAIDGREIKPGFKLFTTIALQDREDSADTEAFKRPLSETVDALLGTNKDSRPDFNREVVDSVKGRACMATVYIDEYPQGSGQRRNKVRRLKAIQ